MKARKSEIDGLIALLFDSFKRSKNLPYTIKTNFCPTKKKNCTRHHGEVVVASFNPDMKKFHCVYYGVHTPKIVLEYDQNEDYVRTMIKDSLTKKYQNHRTLVEVKELKKFIRRSEVLGNRATVTFHCTNEQKEMYLSDAKKHGFRELSDYIKLKLSS